MFPGPYDTSTEKEEADCYAVYVMLSGLIICRLYPGNKQR